MRSRRIVLAIASITLVAPLLGCLAPSDDDYGACTGVLDGQEVSLDLRPERSQYELDALTDDPLLTMHYSDGAGHEVDVTEARLEGPPSTLPLRQIVPLDAVFGGASYAWIFSWVESTLRPVAGSLELTEATDTIIAGEFDYVLPGDDALSCTFSLSRAERRSASSGGGSSDWDWD